MIAPTYNLDNVVFLERDIKMVFNRLDNLYEINAEDGQLAIAPKVKYDASKFAWGQEAADKFNNMIPEIKSIHKDMYSIIEAIYKNNPRKQDDVKELEKKYPKLRLFRLLNNKFKHFDTTKAYDQIRVLHTAVPEREAVEVWIQFIKGEHIDHVLYPEFIVLFFKVLWDYNVIRF